MLKVGQIFNKNGVELCVLDIINYNSKNYVLFAVEDKKVDYLFYELSMNGNNYEFKLVDELSVKYALFDILERKEENI